MNYAPPQFPSAGRGSGILTPGLLNGAAVFTPANQETPRTSSAELLSLMLSEKLQNKRVFWTLYRGARPQHASLLGQFVTDNPQIDVTT